jgi:YfiH family protein
MFLKTFKILGADAGLVHGFSTRIGGISLPPFDSLNTGLHTTDDPKAVRHNRNLIWEKLGIPPDRLVFPEQTHSDTVQAVTEPGRIAACDALVTNTPQLFLTVQTADCFPVFLYDPEKRAVALAHSGWRGTAKNITAKTIAIMQERFGSRAGDLRAAIGAGVQQTCYQVDEPTAQYFDPKYLTPDGPGHYKLNLQSAITDQLIQQGVTPQFIEADKTCTHCAAALYFSHRRDRQRSGRMLALIGIR